MAMLPMVVPIFISAFRRADELSVAMGARGYRGARNRTAKEVKRMDKRSWLALAISAVICAAEVFI
jgi:energy-coupling factor transport system permease protein